MSFWSAVGGNAQRIFDMALRTTETNLGVASRLVERFGSRALPGLGGTKRVSRRAHRRLLRECGKSRRRS